MIGHVQIVDAQVVQTARLRSGSSCFDAVLTGGGGEQGGVQMVVQTCVYTEAQTLREAMIVAVPHVPLSRADRGIVRHLDGRAVRAAVCIPFHCIVAEETNALRFLCVKDGAEECVDRVLRIAADGLCEEVRCRFRIACCTRRLFLLREGCLRLCVAVGTELEIHAESVDARLRRTVVVAVVEDVVDADVRHCILAELLLQHEVPYAERLALIAPCARLCILVFEDVAAIQVAVHRHVVCAARDRVAVEHMDVVVAPEGCAEAAARILVVNADVDLVFRLVEELARHVRITLVDRMEIGVTKLARPMFVESLLDLHLKSRDLGLADVFKAVEHIGRVAKLLRCLEIRVEVDVVARVVGRHVVADGVAEEVQPHGGLLRFALDANVEVDGLFGLQVWITCPVPAETCAVLVDGAAAVHLPVVVEFAHAGFCIACAEICLEAQVRIALDDVVRQTKIRRHMRAEEAAVVEAQDGREDRIVIHHPCVADHKMILVDRRLANDDLILQRVLNLTEELTVQRIVKDLIGIAVIGKPIKVTVPPDEIVRILGADLAVERVISCPCPIGIDGVQGRVEVFRTIVGIPQIVLVGELRSIRIGIAAVIAIEFVVHIPAQSALCVRQQFMCVDKGGYVPLF